MKIFKQKTANYAAILLILAMSLLALGVGGCGQKGMRIVPVSNRDVMALSSDDIVQIMRQSGFSDTQIQEHGWAVRDGLARYGTVDVMISKVREARYAINGNEVFIATSGRGYFIYNPQTGWGRMK